MSYFKTSQIRLSKSDAGPENCCCFLFLQPSRLHTIMQPTLVLPLERRTPRRPPLALLGAEPWRAAYEYVSHKLTTVKPTGQGDGHPVVIFPGMAADGRSVAPLRKYCHSLGYEAFDWGRGFNTGPQGDVDAWLRDLAEHTQALLAGSNGGATLIGWSLGGLYAREIAKLIPTEVRQVITIGTPFNADADHTNVGWLFRLLTRSPPVVDLALAEQLRTAPPVPTTSIYSRTDGVVAWQSCLHDDATAHVQDIEVIGSHTGLGWNPSVLRVVADRLAQRPGHWQAY